MRLWDHQPEIRTIHSNSRKIFRRFLRILWVWSLHIQLMLRLGISWRLALPIIYSALCHGPSMHLQYSRQLALDTIWSNKHRHYYYVRALFTIGVVAVLFGWTFDLFSGQHCHLIYISYGVNPSCKSQNQRSMRLSSIPARTVQFGLDHNFIQVAIEKQRAGSRSAYRTAPLLSWRIIILSGTASSL